MTVQIFYYNSNYSKQQLRRPTRQTD